MTATNNVDAPCVDGTSDQQWNPDTSIVQNPAWSTFPPAIQSFALSVAVQVLWGATGRKFNLCDITVRPCLQQQLPTYLTFPSIWNPGAEGGQWAWGLVAAPGGTELIFGGCGCVSGRCNCTPPQMPLPSPVWSITNVTIDGAALDPTAYRLDGNLLVRQDGGTWPMNQQLGLPAGQPNTWTVRYLRGTPVPIPVNQATGFYAGELAKSMVGGACQLPQRVRTINRQGVSVDLALTENYLDKGLTGVPLVDQIIRTYNPFAQRSPARVISLDMPTYR